MAKLTYTNTAGQKLEFGESAPFLVTKIDGLGSPASEIHRQKSPGQDGATVVGSALEERNLVLEGVILSRDREKDRRRLARIFNPKQGGRLRFERGPTIKEISCEVERVDFPSAMQDNYQVFLISLICPNPFWLDDHTLSEEIVTWIGGMKFPLRLPTAFATKGPPVINIINQGDVETPVRIKFMGPATNPKIIKRDTGEYIQVNRELVYGDTLVITTDFGAKRVEINGQNVFNWIDLGSSFWQLDVGDNVIEYSSDDLVEPAAVSISYRNRYVGV